MSFLFLGELVQSITHIIYDAFEFSYHLEVLGLDPDQTKVFCFFIFWTYWSFIVHVFLTISFLKSWDNGGNLMDDSQRSLQTWLLFVEFDNFLSYFSAIFLNNFVWFFLLLLDFFLLFLQSFKKHTFSFLRV